MGERSRWPMERAIVAALGGAMLAGVAVGAVSPACDSSGDLCDPSIYPGGATDPKRVSVCCDPILFDGGATDPMRLAYCCPFAALPECSDTGSDGGDASADGPIESCAGQGQCLPIPPGYWENPSLVWIGQALQAPPCPEAAPKEAFNLFADLNAPDLCGACQCDPPTGSCGLPATLTARAATCADVGPATPATPFDPPDGGWDGGCTASDAVDGGQLCDGGACVQSLTIGPLIVNDVGCASTQAPVTKDPPTWGMSARVCRGAPFGACGNDGLVCSPSPAPGFHVCVYQMGIMDCTDPLLAPYTEKHVFYQKFHDTRDCSPCACGPPVGSACSTLIKTYSDSACSLEIDSAQIDSSGSLCHDVLAGSALGSKSASPPTYTPGTCQPSGGPTGSAVQDQPQTFCCIPSP
jgi:hypothetical protein